MNLSALWETLQSSSLAAAIRGDLAGTEWIFPIIETCHVIALSIMVGSIAMVDARLLGIGRRSTAVRGVTAELLPVTWTAWGFAALFGSLLFISKAKVYAGNVDFRMKFVLMGLAGLNMVVFHRGVFREVAGWDTGEPPPAARIAGALSLAFWIGVVFFGRWTGFTT
jgi:hypothetical protein